MKILSSRVSGGPETLVWEEAAEPTPAPREVLIDVRAVGINFPDWLMIRDLYQLKPPRPFAPGGELAGRVRSVGAEVTRFSRGERVIAMPGWGALAERVAVDEDRCIAIPAAMSFEEGATLVATYGTSIYALQQRARLQPGETLLVLGAGGGIGIAAVELARAMGARVIAAASSQEKVDFALAAGATAGVVYSSGALDKSQQRALTEALRTACGGGADVVLDPVGGDYAEPALRALHWDGRYLVVGFTAGIPKPPLNLVLLKGSAVLGVLFGAWVARAPAAFKGAVDELFGLYAKGLIKPRISARFPRAGAAAAILAVGERRALGKIVVVMGDSD
jgi:NADPH2:quinone reductase